MPHTGWDAQGNRTEYCDERKVGDADGAAVSYSCGRALPPGNTSGKCDDCTPKAEARVEGSHAGAGHVRAEVCREWVPKPTTGGIRTCGMVLPCPVHPGPPRAAVWDPRAPPAPRAQADCAEHLECVRSIYEREAREVERLLLIRDETKQRAEDAAKAVAFAASSAQRALEAYQSMLRDCERARQASLRQVEAGRQA